MILIGKKGNVTFDAAIVIFILVVFAMISIFANSILSDFTDSATAGGEFTGDANESIVDIENRLPATLDGAFALAFGLLWLMVLIASFMIDSHPAFFIISLVLLIGVLLGAGLIGEAYSDFIEDGDISTFADEFPISNFIMDHLIIVILAIGGSIAIVQFAKRSL